MVVSLVFDPVREPREEAIHGKYKVTVSPPANGDSPDRAGYVLTISESESERFNAHTHGEDGTVATERQGRVGFYLNVWGLPDADSAKALGCMLVSTLIRNVPVL